MKITASGCWRPPNGCCPNTKRPVRAFYLGGWTTTNFSLSQYLKADMVVFIPATYLLIALTTWLFFRNATLTLLAVVNISVCLGATRGLMGMTGIALNNVTSIVIPLVMALSLCDTVHIFAHMDGRLLERSPGQGGGPGRGAATCGDAVFFDNGHHVRRFFLLVLQ